jgi:hypothetical protein
LFSSYSKTNFIKLFLFGCCNNQITSHELSLHSHARWFRKLTL